MLAGLTSTSAAASSMLGASGMYHLAASAANVSRWITVSNGPTGVPRFIASTSKGELGLARLSDVLKEVYTVYFNVTTKA